jgi:pimeloyl-ACP methyl ester carboxylesterase
MTTESKLKQDFIPVFTSPEDEEKTWTSYRRVLDAWPVDYEERLVSTSFGETHVIVSGPADGPPVVLLHALLATATSWYRSVEALSQTYRTYCVDVIGEANPSRPIKPISSLDEFALWFTELIDGLGLDTLYLVGNSYGGFTAAYYAMKLPERVKKLVLIGPASTIHSMFPFMLHMFIPKGLYLAAPWLPGEVSAVRHSLKWMMAGLARDPLWAPLFFKTMRYGKLINRVFPRVYKPEEMTEIKCPVMFMFGERERIYGDLDSAIASAKTLLPEAEVVVVPQAHHIAAVANPEFVNKELLAFFEQ